MDEAIRAEIENMLATINSLVRVLDATADAATRSTYQDIIFGLRQTLQTRISQLVAAGEGPSVRGVIARGLAQVGVNVGKALGATTGSVVRVAGKAVVEIAEIFAATVAAVVTVLTTPSDISGVDERVVEEFILRVGDECFRLSWIETKGSDELIWSPPRLRTQLVDCPPSEEPTVHA